MKKKLWLNNLFFVMPFLILITISLLLMYHAGFISNLYANHFSKQLLWFGLGFLLLFLMKFIPIKYFFTYSFWLYLFNVFLLGLVLLIGKEINGAKAWLDFKFFSFQPSEFMKLTYSFYLAHLCSKKKFYSFGDEFKFLLYVLLLLILPCILVFLEPDTGAILFYCLITLVLLWNSKIHKWWFLIAFILAASIIGGFFYCYFFQKDFLISIIGTTFFYRVERLFSFGTGMQIENAKSPMADPIPGYGGAEILKKYAQANNAAMDNGLSNGNTYCLNAVIQPSVKSVFSIMKDLSNQEFFNLCNGITNDMLTATGLVEIKTNDKEEDKEAKYGKYKIFMNNKGLDQNVSFFSGYNYTVYVPSDAAVLAEINEKQLPTPEKIAEYIAQYQEDPQWETVYKEKAKTQILVLLDFLRTHFQDNSIFADLQAGELQTNNSATLDPNTGTFRKIYVHQLGNNEMTVRTIDKECKVVGTKNAVARDYITTATKNFEDITDLSGILINSSAHSVVHEIDGVLRFDNIKSYTDLWDNSASAKRIIASFEKNK